MARTFTVAQLTTRIRTLTETTGSSFVSDGEIQAMMSTVYGELYERLVASGHRYFETTETITTSGAATSALPAGHLGTVGVDYQAGTNDFRELDRLTANERNAYNLTSADRAYAYAVVGSNIVLYPTPPSGQSYRHTYVPQPTDLSSVATNTSVDVVTAAGEDFLVWGVARMVLAKGEEDTSVAERNFARAQERLEEMAQHRLIADAHRMSDANRLDPGFPGDFVRRPWWV